MEPVHIQMNANNRKLSVINASHRSLQDFSVAAEIVDFNMNVIWKYTDVVSVNTDSYKECADIPKPMNSTPIYFVRLSLKDKAGSLISENLYWQCAQHEDFSPLTVLPKVNLEKSVSINDQGDELRITVNLKNEGNSFSFFNRLKLCSGKTGDEVLPVFWSDNFVTLFPGETKKIIAIVAKTDLAGTNPVIEIE